MREKVESTINGIEYYQSDVVRIVNSKQAATYMEHGAKQLDVYSSRDYKSNDPIVVFIFNRADTKDLYDLWCDHNLK